MKQCQGPVSKPFVVCSLMYLKCPDLHNIKEESVIQEKTKNTPELAGEIPRVTQATVICVDTLPNPTQSAGPTAHKVGPFGNLKESNGITCVRAAADEGTCAWSLLKASYRCQWIDVDLARVESVAPSPALPPAKNMTGHVTALWHAQLIV